MNAKSAFYPALLLIGVTLAAPISAAEPSAKMLANTCSMCHGTDGRSSGSIEKLYGMASEDFIDEMQEFQGEGKGRVMQHIVKAYTPEQIRLMAQYFESLPRN